MYRFLSISEKGMQIATDVDIPTFMDKIEKYCKEKGNETSPDGFILEISDQALGVESILKDTFKFIKAYKEELEKRKAISN